MAPLLLVEPVCSVRPGSLRIRGSRRSIRYMQWLGVSQVACSFVPPRTVCRVASQILCT